MGQFGCKLEAAGLLQGGEAFNVLDRFAVVVTADGTDYVRKCISKAWVGLLCCSRYIPCFLLLMFGGEADVSTLTICLVSSYSGLDPVRSFTIPTLDVTMVYSKQD